MPLGIVTDEDFERELSKINDKPSKAEIIQMPSPGRKIGDNNVPESLRKVIAQNAIEEGNQATKEITKEFKVSDSSLSAYKNGARSTTSYDSPSDGLQQTVNDTKTKIVARAKSRLLSAITNITKEKLSTAKARDLAGIAKDLSAVVKTMEPEVPQSSFGSGPTFVFYTPPQKKEEFYETIVLKE